MSSAIAGAALMLSTLLSSIAAGFEGGPVPGNREIRSAVKRALPLIQRTVEEYPKSRTCFSCHHQALPAICLSAARRHGFEVSADVLAELGRFTGAFLQTGKEAYLAGKGQGGQVDTAGYALWTLDLAGVKADSVTEAVTEFLLKWERDPGHWSASGNRPPSEGSPFAATYVALRALRHFGSPDQREKTLQKESKVLAWLTTTPAKDTEDRVFRLRALHLMGAPNAETDAAARELTTSQLSDGGWSQIPEIASDAYATGSVLAALAESGRLLVSDPNYRRGLNLLVNQQLPDGTWHVASRSKPFQTYFESGFPHGKDQFISLSATCWAVTALALSQPLAR